MNHTYICTDNMNAREKDKIYRSNLICRLVLVYLKFSVKTGTLSKYVPEDEQMRKWIVEFLSKFRGRGIKISS